MSARFFRASLCALSALLAGCHIALPQHRFDELCLAIKGDEDGLFRAHLEKHLAFAGYRIADNSRFCLKIKNLESRDRDMGFRRGKKAKAQRLKASEADLTLSTTATLVDGFEGGRFLGRRTISAWNCFDFAERLHQKQLEFSRGGLTTRYEARHFAIGKLREQLAGKIAHWVQSCLQKAAIEPRLELQTALSEGGAEQIVFPDIDQDAFEDL